MKGLVEQMGGEIGIISEPGHGATFWFTLNLSPCSNAIKLRDFNVLQGKSIALCDSSELHGQVLSSLFLSWGLK